MVLPHRHLCTQSKLRLSQVASLTVHAKFGICSYSTALLDARMIHILCCVYNGLQLDATNMCTDTETLQTPWHLDCGSMQSERLQWLECLAIACSKLYSLRQA